MITDYFEIGWKPFHPNALKKRDSKRLKKKKMNRWPPLEERKKSTCYVWFNVSKEGEQPCHVV